MIKSAGNFNGVMLDNLDAPWSSSQLYHTDGLQEMFIPAAKIVREHDLGVWANGPHVSKTGSFEANATAWKHYLHLASFTTIFEIALDQWLDYPQTNFSQNLNWPVANLGGYVLDIPDNASSGSAIDESLRAGIDRGLSWLYPTITCQHRTGSCTYAHLPTYWTTLVSAFKKINYEHEVA